MGVDCELAIRRRTNISLKKIRIHSVSRTFLHSLFLYRHSMASVYSISKIAHNRPSRKALLGFIKASLSHPTHPLRRDISNKTIITILFTSNMIGSLFARSLHYQFYSWTAWTMPFLLWRTGWHPVIQGMTFLLEEWAWNVFPSTTASSLVLVSVYVAVLAGVWWNWGEEEGVRGELGLKAVYYDGYEQDEKLLRNGGINGIPA